MLTAIVAIFAGLVLLAGSMGSLPTIGHALDRLGRWLGKFDAVIGIAAIVVGLLDLFSFAGLMLILAGLILAVSMLRSLPPLARLGRALSPYRLLIGIVVLVIGMLGLIPQLLEFSSRS